MPRCDLCGRIPSIAYWRNGDRVSCTLFHAEALDVSVQDKPRQGKWLLVMVPQEFNDDSPTIKTRKPDDEP